MTVVKENKEHHSYVQMAHFSIKKNSLAIGGTTYIVTKLLVTTGN